MFGRRNSHPNRINHFIGDEFIATLYRIDEDGEVEYQMQMAILEMDLEEA